MAGSCPPTAPTGPPQGAPQSPMLPAHRTRRRSPGSSGPPAAGGAKVGQPQATQAKDDTSLPAPENLTAASQSWQLEVIDILASWACAGGCGSPLRSPRKPPRAAIFAALRALAGCDRLPQSGPFVADI